jgi:hypothetical protein
MSGLPFARRYWNRLTNADTSDGSQPAGRGQRGYTFGRRYWAAFVAVDLPVRETVGLAEQRGSAGSGLSSPDDDPGAEFRRTSPGRYVIDGQEADVQLEAVPSGAGTFTVTIRTGLARSGSAAVTAWLEVQGSYFVALLTAAGTGIFEGVPAGPWSLGFLPRPADIPRYGAMTLPRTRAAADLAAASEGTGTAILKVKLSDGRTELALHRQGASEYLLEVTVQDALSDPEVLTVYYGTSGGGRRLLIPVIGRAALARLPGYVAGAPWAASVLVPVGEVRSWDALMVRESFDAAVGGSTRRAWRAIGAAVPEVRQVTG